MIAAYYRLSQADEITSGKEESNSIINQRNMIRSYVAEHTDLASMAMTEFTDDGFSGTSVDRPAFKEMLEGVKHGVIRCIIVKDFSRFARNYIEAGDYIERTFPFLGVRFIAVTDGYDSAHLGNNDSKNMEMVIKNVINAAYSKDLSAKICASNQVKRNQLQYLGGLRPYGFLPDPEDSHKLIVDPVAGQYVKRIFLLAAEGKKPSAIARVLNDDSIPTPSAYFLKTGSVTSSARSWKSSAANWDTAKVRSILKNEKYKGTFVAKSRVQTAPCSKHTVKNSKDRVVLVENAHESIVSAEIFERAQLVIKKAKDISSRTKRSYPLKGKVICGGCGRNMGWDDQFGKFGAYRCRNTTSGSRTQCAKKRILTEDILDKICDSYESCYDYLCCELEKVKEQESEYYNRKSSLEMMQIELMEQKRQLSARKVQTYEDFAAGLMSREDFTMLKKDFENEYRAIESAIQENNSATNALAKQGRPNSESLESIVSLAEKNLTPEQLGIALDEFIHRVIIYPSNHAQIVWCFENELSSHEVK